jgi:plastocyanin
MRRIAFVPILAALLAVAGCSSGSGSSAAPATPAGASVPAASAAGSPAGSGGGAGGAACSAAPAGSTAAVTVAIKDFKFAPQPVEAKVGDVIAWSNQDAAPHSATLDDGTCDTKTISSGAQAMLVFTAPGTYTYHCSVHPAQMKDYTIDVK